MESRDDSDSLADDGLLHVNGIDGLTGLPAVPAISLQQAIDSDPSLPLDPASASRLAAIEDSFKRKTTNDGLPLELEFAQDDLSKVGWAVVFASDLPAGVREAVEPLIAHRRDHNRIPTDLLKVLDFAPAASLDEWLQEARRPSCRRLSRRAALLRDVRRRP